MEPLIANHDMPSPGVKSPVLCNSLYVAIRALSRMISHHNLLAPALIRGFLRNNFLLAMSQTRKHLLVFVGIVKSR